MYRFKTEDTIELKIQPDEGFFFIRFKNIRRDELDVREKSVSQIAEELLTEVTDISDENGNLIPSDEAIKLVLSDPHIASMVGREIMNYFVGEKRKARQPTRRG
jgi:hypothetical protein